MDADTIKYFWVLSAGVMLWSSFIIAFAIEKVAGAIDKRTEELRKQRH